VALSPHAPESVRAAMQAEVAPAPGPEAEPVMQTEPAAEALPAAEPGLGEPAGLPDA
jgi:hypothetical protein